jgi:putative transposase
MTLYRNKYRIESRRLKGWDYGWAGKYFVTICTAGMNELFAKVRHAEMLRNDVGEIAYQTWTQSPEHHKHTYLDEFKVMPNHIHGIVVIRRHPGSDANIRVANKNMTIQPSSDLGCHSTCRGGATGMYNPMVHSVSLSKAIRWFKGRASYEIHKIDTDFEWQPRFHDHIIRGESELNSIRQYIRNNPKQWEMDRNHPSGLANWLD